MKYERAKGLHIEKANAAVDIDLINKYSVKKLEPDEVYCFSLVLCDNDIDRDDECFTDTALDKLAELFLGKTGISDHVWKAERQIARIYRTRVETLSEKNKRGRPLKQLKADAYMLNTESNRHIIEAIEGGIMKEVSVGCSIGRAVCSICSTGFHYDLAAGETACENGHRKGKHYAEGMCVCELDQPSDAYEFSFVAVPAQRGAGVTKAFENIDGAFELLMTATADICAHTDKAKALITRLQSALLSASETEERRKALAENKNIIETFLKG